MPNRNGVSMLSLVIIVVVTILLAMIATTAGFRYVESANQLKAKAISEIIGTAAYQRQNDLSAGVSNRYYDGYAFNIDLLKSQANYDNVKGLPKFTSGDFEENFQRVFEKENANWYVIDAESAINLGAKETEGFLTQNISYISSAGSDEVKVILVDYTNGDSYYVTFPKEMTTGDSTNGLIRKNPDGSQGCMYSSNGQHRYTVATCTEPAICIYCNAVDPEHGALNHDFVPATCTQAEYCKRCGVTRDQPLGHSYLLNNEIVQYTETMKAKDLLLFDSSGTIDPKTLEYDNSGYAWVTDAVKHWHECTRCGNRIDEGAHNKIMQPNANNNSSVVYKYNTNIYHYESCNCGWYSVASPHNLVVETVQNPLGEAGTNTANKNALDNQHKVRCTLCSYESIHNDTGWLPGNEMYHYRKCLDASSSNCNTHKLTLNNGKVYNSTELVNGEEIDVLFLEEHYDNNHDFICDVAGCGRYIDKIPPLDFGIGNQTYVNVKSRTTHSISLEAYTIDNESGIDYYEFGIYNPTTNSINWYTENRITPASRHDSVTFEFNDLKPISNYTFYVRAYDKNNNSNNAYRVNTSTLDFPAFSNIKDVPQGVIKGPAEIGLEKIETELPKDDVYLQYSNDNRSTWSFINLNDIETTKVQITEPNTNLIFRFVDYGNVSDAQAPNRNYSKEYSYNINVIDNTAPNVSIVGKSDSSVLKSIHYATVRIEDPVVDNISAGIAPNTEVEYGWSTSPNVRPSQTTTIKTTNTSKENNTTVDIPTPASSSGIYYLWIMRGIKDAVENATNEDIVSSISFNVDDVEATLTNIVMTNENPSITGMKQFAKTGDTVTITFTASKILGKEPVVKLNDRDVTNITTYDGVNYTCRIQIDDSFEEGTLQLKISDVVSHTGRVDEKVYTNSDLTGSAVIYDKTPPSMEYVKKT